MPAVSLVICVYGDRDYLVRLLANSQDCWDELIVIHDTPDEQNVSEIVRRYGGRFFLTERLYHQEVHWPFAWQQARNDWILRLDADEFPSDAMRSWLKEFRSQPSPPDVSGYTCIWPLWNGRRKLTRRWPDGRVFLLNRQRVRFIGMPESSPIPDGHYLPLPLVLEHQPTRPSSGVRNSLFQARSVTARNIIAKALLGKPTDLKGWRWTDDQWPTGWEQLRRRPLWTGLKRLVKWPLVCAFEMIRHREWPRASACLAGAVYHCSLGITLWRLQQRIRHHGRDGNVISGNEEQP